MGLLQNRPGGLEESLDWQFCRWLSCCQTGSDALLVFPGSIDEVRISTVARSADWVKASHDTVNGSNFATYGSAGENADKGLMIFVR